VQLSAHGASQHRVRGGELFKRRAACVILTPKLTERKSPAMVCGPTDKPPPNAVAVTSFPGDCDDKDPSIRTVYYEGLDGDGFAASDEKSKCGSPVSAPPGFGIFIPGWRDSKSGRSSRRLMCDENEPRDEEKKGTRGLGASRRRGADIGRLRYTEPRTAQFIGPG
jgi:hypothetical protein